MPTLDELLERFRYRPDEVVDALRQLPPAPADAAAVPDQRPEEFLAFNLGEQLYAVPIHLVREILKVGSVTEVPRAAPQVIGLINVRGEMLPLYDVKVHLALADRVPPVRTAADVPRPARIVLVRDPAGDAGVLVDRVHGVVRLPPGQLEDPPAAAGAPRGVVGLARRDALTFLVLDLGQVLA